MQNLEIPKFQNLKMWITSQTIFRNYFVYNVHIPTFAPRFEKSIAHWIRNVKANKEYEKEFARYVITAIFAPRFKKAELIEVKS